MHDGEPLLEEEEVIDNPPQRACTWFRALGAGVVAIVVAVVLYFIIHHPSTPPPSKSSIVRACSVFCEGRLLKEVQLSGLFNDSKTFVDRPMLQSPESTLDAFSKQFPKGKGIEKGDLESFVDKHFGDAGSDLIRGLTPPDHIPNPFVVRKQTNSTLRTFASSLNTLWAELYAKVHDNVKKFPERHTLLPLPKPFVLPGGRFRETYFWDSYWIVRGLLACNMSETAGNLVENLVALSDMVGHIPNGARAYYADRSQPPVLTDMALAIYHATGDAKVARLASVAKTAKKQIAHFSDSAHTIKITHDDETTYTLSRYGSSAGTPRPESYAEDYATGNMVPEHSRTSLFNNIRAAAESGWDFGTRWLSNATTMSSARTMDVVPVDLNSHLCRLEANLAEINHVLGVEDEEEDWRERVSSRATAMTAILWREEMGLWTDAWVNENSWEASPEVTPASFVPLWSPCYVPGVNKSRDHLLFHAWNSSGLSQEGGVLTSKIDSGQQWDSPNAWPPLVWWMIHGLDALGSSVPEAKTEATQLARTWLRANLLGFNRLGFMAEKWNAFQPGASGGGGEYIPQKGFGWTNGVVLDLLATYSFSSLE